MKILSALITLILAFNLFAVEPGTAAPSITLNHFGIDGQIRSAELLEKEISKKFLLLEFMSITCRYCVENMPKIAMLQSEVGDLLTIKLVSTDRDIVKVQEFISKYQDQIEYQFVFDNKKQAKELYNIVGVPTIFIIDESGTIIYKHLGSLPDEEIDKIKMILN